MLSSVRRSRLGRLIAAAVVVLSAPSAPSAYASTVVGEWGMNNVDDSSRSAGGMTFSGNWQPVSGVVGGAVKLTDAPSSGVARGTADKNPGAKDFAMSLVFTSRPIPTGVGYSGNLMQKGYFFSPGQVKMQLVPANGGTVNCRVKGGQGGDPAALHRQRQQRDVAHRQLLA
jgi:hypothetical protein